MPFYVGVVALAPQPRLILGRAFVLRLLESVAFDVGLASHLALLLRH